ncbi:HAMP domain-containing histidine kinase [Pedobacter boryungensis]|uniref:histidine kinase n=1 Tax=Pedobacter boryungensis TaxID=869962 RepID=A0ABX2DC19_9SPHI|nr:HAMP domain-containing histidine kinase [Pedobacter boryungensis]
MDQDLEEETLEVRNYAKNNVFYRANDFEDLIVQYKQVASLNGQRELDDTLFYNPIKKIKESGRYLSTDLSINGKNYRVWVIASKFNRNEQVKSIFLIIVLPVIFLLVIVLLINGIMMKRMWSPFRKLLGNIQKFNINHEHPFEPINTTITEFSQLNDAVLELAKKVKSDYSEVKLFTENASHEMMTPLAVINSKLDTMLQFNLSAEEQSEILVDLYRATAKLTKLNQSLLLLVKIDNSLPQPNEEIDIEQLINDRLEFFQELITSRKLNINAQLKHVKVLANANLFEILINNLLSNAIRHNVEGGAINIKLNQTELIVSNTGSAQALDENLVFERFYKDPASEGTGLGLAILKQVASKMGYQLTYRFMDNLHHFKVRFSSDKESK